MSYSKGAQDRYNAKCKKFLLRYTPEDKEGTRLRKYLDDTKQSANGYLKGVVKDDLDSKGIE